jgi:NAD-dependent deacetylase
MTQDRESHSREPHDREHADGSAGATARARDLVRRAGRIVVLTGAGISTDSGIPDFRGPNGVWTRNPEAEKYSTIQYYLSDPELRQRAWLNRLDNPAWTAEPNVGHQALVDLERSGRMDLLVTQNIDGLHQAAGSDPERVVEMHGSIREAHCVECRWRGPMQAVLDRVRSGEPDPSCPECGGILKSTTVFFGENLDETDLQRAFAAAAGCDLLLAVGTTLGVFPVARLVPTAVAAGARVVIVNGSPTEQDDAADVVVLGSISEVLPTLVR